MDLLIVFKQLLVSQKNRPSDNTVKNYISDVRHFLEWYRRTFGHEFSILDLNSLVLEDFKKREGAAESTKERQVAALKKLFSLLAAQGTEVSPVFTAPQINSPQDGWKMSEFKHHLNRDHASTLTIKNYLSDIRHFERWAQAQQIDSAREALSKLDMYTDTLIHVICLSPASVNRKLSTLRKYADFLSFDLKKAEVSTLPSTIGTIEKVSSHESKAITSEANHAQEPLGKPLSSLTPFLVNQVSYSRVPPIRLAQKLFAPYSMLEEKLAHTFAYTLPRRTGKSIKMQGKQELNFLQRLQNSRPEWYKRYHNTSFAQYIHLSVLSIFCVAVGLVIYTRYFGVPSDEPHVLGLQQQNGRVLAYSGTLTDRSGKAITKPTEMEFKLYPEVTGATPLWQESVTVRPNDTGQFQVRLGTSNPLPSAIFLESANLYLGMKIGMSPELSPRQRIANVSLSEDTLSLQGMQPISQNPDNTRNSILSLNSSGNLVIGGSANPVFQASGGDFTLTGSNLILTTNPGTGGSIVLNPDRNGLVDIQKPLVNTSDSGPLTIADELNIATDSANPLATINNLSDTGAIFELMSRNISRLLVDNAGNVGIGTNNPSQLVHIAGSQFPTLRIENLASGTVLDLAALSSSVDIGTKTLAGLNFKTLDQTRLHVAANGNIGIGTTTPTATLDVSGSASISGVLTMAGQLPTIQTANNSNLIIGSISTGNLLLAPLNEASRVGIGTMTPDFKFDVRDTQYKSSVAQIVNTSTDADADGLNVTLGSNTKTNHYINFQSKNGTLVGAITGDGANGVTYETHGVADFAEYLKKDVREAIAYGMLVCLSPNGTVTTCSGNNQTLVGVASERPAFLGGENHGDASVAVGLVGQVETLVSAENGPIYAGDPIALSSTPGVGTKAQQPGTIVGRALENYTGVIPSKIKVLVQPTWYSPDIYLTQSGTIETESLETPTELNAQFADVVLKVANTKSRITALEKTITAVSNLASATIGTVKAGLITTENAVVSGTLAARTVITDSLTVTSEHVVINGKPLHEYIASLLPPSDFRSQSASAERISTQYISPLADSSDISVRLNQSKVEIGPRDASAAATISFDPAGNATFSGTVTASTAAVTGSLSADTAAFRDASISGRLTADSIAARSIDGLEDTVATIASRYINTNQNESNNTGIAATDLPDTFVNIASVSADFAYFKQNLLSLGTTTLREATVMDSLSVGTTLHISSNSLDVIGSNLEFQPLGQGGVSFLAGKITIDPEGNLNVGGEAIFAKNVKIKGGLLASIISPLPDSDLDIFLSEKSGSNSAVLNVRNASKTPVLTINRSGDVYSSGSAKFAHDLIASGSAFLSKLNIVSQPVTAAVDGSYVASSSAGTASLAAYKREVTIQSPYVTKDSLIYVTPSTNTGNQVLYLLRQNEEDHTFTVGVNQPISRQIEFNWFIVN